MKIFLSTCLSYFLTSLIGLEVLFRHLELKDKYVKRMTSRNKQIVDYRFVSLKVVNSSLSQGTVTLGLLSNKQHSFEAKAEPLLIKATVPHEQIKLIRAKDVHQIEANLQVVIDTTSNIPQIQTKIMRITKYI